MTDTPDASGMSQPSPPQVVGARMIVDVLRHFAGVPPDTVQLTPLRNKAAQFVLEKSLLKIEQQSATLTYPVPQMSLASTLHQFARNEKKILYMSQADWGAAKLIDVIFDAVIDQGKLDAEAIWLLNRFRLPLFHSVLSDYSFFFARQNLARRFVNAVTLHLLTTREPFARDLKFVLGGIASRMYEAFEHGVGKFNALCVEGQTWFATQQQRLQKAELKIREHAENKSRKQAAEERVVLLLNRCIANKSLPTLLIEFITTEWRQLLLWTSTKDGEQGVNWKRQSRLTESMVEFVQACQTEEGRLQYQNFLPSLIKGIHASLSEMIENKSRVSQLIDPVELVLNALAVGAMPDYSTHAGLALPEARTGTFEVLVESNPSLERITALQPGQWVRFRTQDRQYEACALVVKGDTSEPWSFVNQSGQGVVNKTPMQLAALLTSGVLEIVGEGNAIDDVLNHVVAKAAAMLPPVQGPAVTTRLATPQQPTVADASSKRTIEESSPAVTASPKTVAVPEANDVVVPAPAPVTDQAALSALEAVLDTAEKEQQPAEPAEDTELPDEVMQAAFSAVDGLQVGARLIWYKSQDEDVTLKLAVKIRSTEKLVFVNHIGIKTLDTDRKTLAGLIASGRIVIIDIGAKFDSALERIVKQIQQDKK